MNGDDQPPNPSTATNEQLLAWQQAAPGRSVVLPNVHNTNATWQGDGHGARGPQDTQGKKDPRPQESGVHVTEKQWFSTPGGGKVQVTTEDVSGYSPGSGVPLLNGIDVITFDQDNFEIFDGGGGQAVVKLKTCPATCP